MASKRGSYLSLPSSAVIHVSGLKSTMVGLLNAINQDSCLVQFSPHEHWLLNTYLHPNGWRKKKARERGEHRELPSTSGGGRCQQRLGSEKANLLGCFCWWVFVSN